jgi:hypothetical protein
MYVGGADVRHLETLRLGFTARFQHVQATDLCKYSVPTYRGFIRSCGRSAAGVPRRSAKGMIRCEVKMSER